MTWQRRLRLGVGAFLIAFVALLYFAIGRSDRQAPAGPPRRDPDAVQEVTPGTLTLANGERISFARQLTYADGRSVLQDVHVTMPEQGDRVVTLEGREAFQHAASPDSRVGRLTVKGHVVATTSDGLQLQTDQVDYDDATRVMVAPGQLHFTRGRLTGSATGASYDRQSEVISLLSGAQVTLTPGTNGEGALSASSETARFSRRDHQVTLDRHVTITQPDRTVETAQALLYLNEEETLLTRAELRGGSQVVRPKTAPASPGALSRMQARDIDLLYAADGQTLSGSLLIGDAGIEVEGEPSAGPRRIHASRLELSLGGNGATVTALTGQTDVRLELPGSPGRPSQVIRAAALEATGVEREGLRQARFSGDVEFREYVAAAQATAAIERVARSSSLELSLQPNLAGAADARFLGRVVFTDGTWRAEAPEARYDPAAGTLVLLSSKDRSGSVPRVADDRVTVDAGSIELALSQRRLRAENRVQSVFRPISGDRRAPAGDATVRVPMLLSADDPVYVAAGTLAYDGQTSVATYSGAARLWQGDSLIRGESLVLDDRHGNLSASGQVYSALSIGESSTAATPGRTIGEGQEMQYDDEARRAVYRGKAHVNGPEGDLRGERIELYLGETTRALARAEAFGDVSIKIEGGFTATGQRLSYLADTQRYRMQGTPVRILEEKPTECRETTGALLTFTRSIDSISVDGTDGNRSRTRPVPCAERRR